MENDATDPWNYLKAAATVPDRRRIRGSHSIRAPRQSAFERFNVHRTGDTFLETSKEQSRAVEPGVPLLKRTEDAFNIDHSIGPRTGTGVWHRWLVIIPRRSIHGGFVWGNCLATNQPAPMALQEG
jgi:hypothetical protein